MGFLRFLKHITSKLLQIIIYLLRYAHKLQNYCITNYHQLEMCMYVHTLYNHDSMTQPTTNKP
jgi:hypothetical protein